MSFSVCLSGNNKFPYLHFCGWFHIQARIKNRLYEAYTQCGKIRRRVYEFQDKDRPKIAHLLWDSH